MTRKEIFKKVNDERDYQDSKWGTDFDDKNTPNDWATYVIHYVTNATKMKMTKDEYETALLKVIALAVAALEASERNNGPIPRHYDY